MDNVIVWSGWLGGLGVGLYMLLQYWLTGKQLGVSTGYGNACAIVSSAPYFKSGPYAEPFNWRLFFIIGIPLGGLLGLLTSPGAELAPSFSMGPMYDAVFPESIWAKGALVTLGGIFVGYGSRMAGGCTSGHAITGVSLLNPPSIAASVGFFIGGIAIVQLMFNVLA